MAKLPHQERPGKPEVQKSEGKGPSGACAGGWLIDNPGVTFLPIIERELRVAARKRSTFWLRVVAALVALVVGVAFMVLAHFSRMGTATFGGMLFNLLTWMSLGVVLCAGLFFTSDCISEEKREGTLGFLFLTDLRGYDVVGGKLLATSLRGIFALLALFPILAVTLLMGGVTGAQFWKTNLALVNALFVSLALGLVVSSLSRDGQKALGATLLLSLLLIFGGPAVDGLFRLVRRGQSAPLWSLTSPAMAFAIAGAWGRSPFWSRLLTSHFIGWAFLVLACYLAPRTWQAKPPVKETASSPRAYWFRYGSQRRRKRLREKLMPANPVLWLASRERWQAIVVWCLAGVSAVAMIICIPLPLFVWTVWGAISGLCGLVLYIWVASQACRFFAEARRSGLLELLLYTPLSVNRIVAGPWRALVRLFAVPIALLLVMQVIGTAMSQRAVRGAVAAVTKAMPSVTVTNTLAGSNTFTFTKTNSYASVSFGGMAAASSAAAGSFTLPLTMGAITVVATAANLLALCWFGMWMGLTSKNATLATVKTLTFVQIVPSMIIGFISSIVAMAVVIPWLAKAGPAGAPTFFMSSWFPLLSAALGMTLSLAKDLGFCYWSRNKLHGSFRAQVARDLGTRGAPPVIPPLSGMPAPPVITAQ